jgi:hypothetical protein
VSDSSNEEPPLEYQLWREVWRIIEWKDGAIFRTEKIEDDWYDSVTVHQNIPRETNLLYVAGGPSAPLVSIRRKPPAGWDKV